MLHIMKDLVNSSKMLSYYGNINKKINIYFYNWEKKLNQFDEKYYNIPFYYKIKNIPIHIFYHYCVLIILKMVEPFSRIS